MGSDQNRNTYIYNDFSVRQETFMARKVIIPLSFFFLFITYKPNYNYSSSDGHKGAIVYYLKQ